MHPDGDGPCSGSQQALDDRPALLDQLQQVPIAQALLLAEVARPGMLGEAQQAILLDLPLLGEDELIQEIPGVDLTLDLRQRFPCRDRPLQLMINISSCRAICRIHRASSGMFCSVSNGAPATRSVICPVSRS